MGIDKSLSDDHPSVIINRVRYHYGRALETGEYLVENAFLAKDYWWFEREADLVAFLVNLPGSADRGRLPALHPGWDDASIERQAALIEEDRARLRALAAEKMAAGTAPRFVMDLDGRGGPHAPQWPAGAGRSPADAHWIAGVWCGADPPHFGEHVLFRKHLMIPLHDTGGPGPGAERRYVMAEVVAPALEIAVVVGSTKDREYALHRAAQYERGAVPISYARVQEEWEKGRARERRVGPDLEL